MSFWGDIQADVDHFREQQAIIWTRATKKEFDINTACISSIEVIAVPSTKGMRKYRIGVCETCLNKKLYCYNIMDGIERIDSVSENDEIDNIDRNWRHRLIFEQFLDKESYTAHNDELILMYGLKNGFDRQTFRTAIHQR